MERIVGLSMDKIKSEDGRLVVLGDLEMAFGA